MKTYAIYTLNKQPAIHCRVCGMISYHPTDVTLRYCPSCQELHSTMMTVIEKDDEMRLQVDLSNVKRPKRKHDPNRCLVCRHFREHKAHAPESGKRIKANETPLLLMNNDLTVALCEKCTARRVYAEIDRWAALGPRPTCPNCHAPSQQLGRGKAFCPNCDWDNLEVIHEVKSTCYPT